MSGEACFPIGSCDTEPSGAVSRRRDRLPSTRTLNRRVTGKSGPFTVEFPFGLDSIRIACAHSADAPTSNMLRKVR